MKLLRDSVLGFPNRGSYSKIIEVPGMIQKDWDCIMKMVRELKVSLHWGTRPNDYFWGKKCIEDWAFKLKIHNSDMRIIDIGSGCSGWPFYITKMLPGASLKTVDKKDFSKQFLEKSKGQIEFECISADDLILEPGEFNIISLISSVEHFKIDRKKFFQKIIKALPVNGLLVMTTDVALNASMKKADGGYFSLEEILDLLECVDEIEFITEVFEKSKSTSVPNTPFLFAALVKEATARC